MPGGVKRNKGNKKLAAWDRLVVPSVTFRMPPDLVRDEQEIDYPLEPVGVPVTPKTLILYEISPTYNPEPKVNIYRIPFESIIGNWSDEKLKEGYELTTEQGETLLIRWNLQTVEYYDRVEAGPNNGLIIHVKNTNREFPLYDTDWGHVFGVAMEWETIDKKQRGRNWANQIKGYTTTSLSGDLSTHFGFKSPYSIRPELMLGYPKKRTIRAMGAELPLRIFPAVGKKGTGIILGFNDNVSKFIRPPIEPYINIDFVMGYYGYRIGYYNIDWQKDDFAKKTVLRIKCVENTPTKISRGYWSDGIFHALKKIESPELNVEYNLIDPTNALRMTDLSIYLDFPEKSLNTRPDKTYIFEIKLYEWDDDINDVTRLISCIKVISEFINNKLQNRVINCDDN